MIPATRIGTDNLERITLLCLTMDSIYSRIGRTEEHASQHDAIEYIRGWEKSGLAGRGSARGAYNTYEGRCRFVELEAAGIILAGSFDRQARGDMAIIEDNMVELASSEARCFTISPILCFWLSMSQCFVQISCILLSMQTLSCTCLLAIVAKLFWSFLFLLVLNMLALYLCLPLPSSFELSSLLFCARLEEVRTMLQEVLDIE